MMETVEALITGVAGKVLGTSSVKRPATSNVQRIIREMVQRLESLAKQADETVGDHLTKESIADEVRKNVAPLISELTDLGGKITHETSDAEVRAQITPSVLEALMERAGRMTSAKPVHPPGVEVEGVKHFDAAWKHSCSKVGAHTRFELQRLKTELENPAIELGKWERRRYKDLVRGVAGSDWFEVSPAERRRRAIEDLKLGGEIAEGYEDFEVTGAVFEKLIEPTLIQPTFVTHLPKELVPLAKLSPDDPTTVEVFECCINGQEIAPGYTEQNDPIQQRSTLEHQAGGEQQKLDEDFLVALEHGMPPAGGIGIGIDRLCMMLLGQESIRDVILFPQLKPK
jgi:hypothetical protein